MAQVQVSPRMSYAEYLVFEATAEERHEFHHGELFAMSVGTPVHARLIGTVDAALFNALRGHPCLLQSSAQRVRLAPHRAAYADALVVCPPLQRADDDPDAITNPVVVVEVLSPSTEAYDRGEKFAAYRALASVQHVLFVSQTRWSIEHFRRGGDGSWRLSDHGPGSRVELDAIGASIAVDEVYERIEEFGGPARSEG